MYYDVAVVNNFSNSLNKKILDLKFLHDGICK